MDGDYIVVDKDTFTQVAFSPSAYKIVDNKLIKKPVEQTNGKKQKRFTLQECREMEKDWLPVFLK